MVTAQDAVERAQRIVGRGGHYQLGTGDYAPCLDHLGRLVDTPWGSDGGCDCAGFAISWAWCLKRHRPGFNNGDWATVSDDLNVNSAIEDGDHKRELFTTLRFCSCCGNLPIPVPGDLLCYPTFRLRSHDDPSQVLTFIGHVGLVETVPADYKPGEGWTRLGVLQCHGPNGRAPAVVRTNGAIWDQHDHVWPKPEHQTVLVRPNGR